MKVAERLSQMTDDLKTLAVWLVGQDECQWAISVLGAANDVDKLKSAFDGNFVGVADFPSDGGDVKS